MGLAEIKGVPQALLARIPAERARGGSYRNLADFIRRVRPAKADLDVLIQCGALDSLGLTRPELQWLADSDYAAGLRAGELPLDGDAGLADFRARIGRSSQTTAH